MRINSLNLRIGGKLVLSDVSFEVNGKTALVGPNGSGKTMTLSVISQLVKPQNGEVLLHDSTRNLLLDEDFKQRMGVLIQNGMFDPENTVLEEMEFIRELVHSKNDAGKNDMKKNNLKKDLNRYNIEPGTLIKHLPHGKYKILLVLQALMNNPEIVILDEPFSGLDVLNRSIIEKILKAYKGKMLITSHQLAEIQNICQDIVFIREGRIIQKKKISQIKNLNKYYIKLYS